MDAKEGYIRMAGVDKNIEQLKNASRYIIIACGTSWHAALIAEYIIEELCRIPVEVEYASEFRYRNPIINKGDVIIAVSQSGETADTLVAIERAKENGAFIFGIVNVVGLPLQGYRMQALIPMPVRKSAWPVQRHLPPSWPY